MLFNNLENVVFMIYNIVKQQVRGLVIEGGDIMPAYKVGEVDKEKFAALVKAAVGKNRTLRDFASLCGVHTSTISRIIKGENKGASSRELLVKIAEHASLESGVTMAELFAVNGYKKSDIPKKRISLQKPKEMITRRKIVNYFLENGEMFRVVNSDDTQMDKYLQTSLKVQLQNETIVKWVFSDLLTWEDEGKLLYEESELEKIVCEKAFSIITKAFFFVSQAGGKQIDRFTLVVYDEQIFDTICRMFEGTEFATYMSVLLLDSTLKMPVKEYVLGSYDTEKTEAYFYKGH